MIELELVSLSFNGSFSNPLQKRHEIYVKMTLNLCWARNGSGLGLIFYSTKTHWCFFKKYFPLSKMRKIFAKIKRVFQKHWLPLKCTQNFADINLLEKISLKLIWKKCMKSFLSKFEITNSFFFVTRCSALTAQSVSGRKQYLLDFSWNR